MTERSVDPPTAPADTALRIRRAAVLLFAQRGYAATSIRDIARAVNMTNAGIYHHVTSKEALLADLMRVGHVRLIASSDQLLAGIERPAERLATLITSLTAIHALNPMTTRVMDGELRSLTPGSAAHGEIIELRDAYEAEWRRTIADGVSRGAFDVADERLARLALMSMCTGTSEWYRPDGESSLDQVCAQFVTIGLAAVNATGPAGEPQFDPTVLPVYPWEPQ
ncbi:MAG TPA: TetR/AcrR family transcriptional regulator [Jiangellaceae bacterium]